MSASFYPSIQPHILSFDYLELKRNSCSNTFSNTRRYFDKIARTCVKSAKKQIYENARSCRESSSRYDHNSLNDESSSTSFFSFLSLFFSSLALLFVSLSLFFLSLALLFVFLSLSFLYLALLFAFVFVNLSLSSLSHFLLLSISLSSRSMIRFFFFVLLTSFFFRLLYFSIFSFTFLQNAKILKFVLCF